MNPSPWKLDGAAATLAAGEFTAQVAVDQPEAGIHAITYNGQAIYGIEGLLGFYELSRRRSDPREPSERRIEDIYIRGRDLVAVYGESEGNPKRYILYWRVLEGSELCGAAAGFDLVVSVQTSLQELHSRALATPVTWVGSKIQATRGWSSAPPDRHWETMEPRPWLDGARKTAEAALDRASKSLDDAFLFDLPGDEWSVADMVHPRDRDVSSATVVDQDAPFATAEEIAESPPGTKRLGVTTGHDVLRLPLEKGVLLRARLRAVLARRENAKEVVAACREAFEHAELPLTT